MEEQLKKFIALSKKEDEEATMEEYKFMKPTILVNTHCEEKTNLDEFKKIIETNDMMEQITPLFICDFYRGEEIEMIEKIKKYGGICEVELNAPNPI